jgi:hypothetical protein
MLMRFSTREKLGLGPELLHLEALRALTRPFQVHRLVHISSQLLLQIHLLLHRVEAWAIEEEQDEEAWQEVDQDLLPRTDSQRPWCLEHQQLKRAKLLKKRLLMLFK